MRRPYAARKKIITLRAGYDTDAFLANQFDVVELLIEKRADVYAAS